jgi:plasmid stabilization system protein ParE
LEYQVRISDSALIDAEEYVQYIRHVKRAPKAADRWFRSLGSAIFSLASLPSRCPLIPESDDFPFEIRHLIFHSHRIISGLTEPVRPLKLDGCAT